MRKLHQLAEVTRKLLDRAPVGQDPAGVVAGVQTMLAVMAHCNSLCRLHAHAHKTVPWHCFPGSALQA
jgi:hypothetical protein